MECILQEPIHFDLVHILHKIKITQFYHLEKSIKTFQLLVKL